MSLRIKFLMVALVSAALARAEIKVGDQFPALAPAGVVSLTGGAVPASGQVMLVDFWASWCAPCKASFPAMAKIFTDYAPRGFVIAAVSVDEKSALAAAFVKKLAPPFLALHDRDHSLVQQVSVPTMPTSYLLDRTGKVRFMHEGFHGAATDKQIRQEIDTLLAEKE